MLQKETRRNCEIYKICPKKEREFIEKKIKIMEMANEEKKIEYSIKL
jgi:hypothetical protein